MRSTEGIYGDIQNLWCETWHSNHTVYSYISGYVRRLMGSTISEQLRLMLVRYCLKNHE